MVFGQGNSDRSKIRSLKAENGDLKKQVEDLTEQLEVRTAKDDLQIWFLVRETEEKLRQKSRQEFTEMSDSMVAANDEFLSVLNDLYRDLAANERQLELARGAYRNNLQELRGVAREGLEVFEKLLLGSDALKRVPAIFVGSENKIVYGTPGFFAKFPLSREEVYRGDVSDLFSYVGEEYSEAVRNYAEENFPGNLELSFVVDGASRAVEIVPMHVDSKWFNGTWLEFKDSGGVFKYFSGIFKKKPSK